MKIEIELDKLTKDEQKTIKKLAKKAKMPFFLPEKDDPYWYVNEEGQARHTQNDEIECDNFFLSIGNCFRTEKEAKEEVTRLQMHAKWKRLSLEAGEADNPWDKTHGHWYPCYDITTSIIIPYWDLYLKHDSIYFPTKESLNDAIAEIGEDNVKKYILGVRHGVRKE